MTGQSDYHETNFNLR